MNLRKLEFLQKSVLGGGGGDWGPVLEGGGDWGPGDNWRGELVSQTEAHTVLTTRQTTL